MELPALPEGHFWRVESDSMGFMMVTIRKKNKRFGSRFIERSMVLEDPPVPSAIMKAAERALTKYNEREDRYAFLAEFRTYEGDYK
jgi:hypothetical protein